MLLKSLYHFKIIQKDVQKMENSLKKKLAQIKLFITDVDGVLTDGSLYYTDEGLVMKKFQVKDGMGTRLLKESGIKTALISTDTSELMKLRGERLKMD
jgi:N-acylneuraminate cytidylyltransferase